MVLVQRVHLHPGRFPFLQGGVCDSLNLSRLQWDMAENMFTLLKPTSGASKCPMDQLWSFGAFHVDYSLVIWLFLAPRHLLWRPWPSVSSQKSEAAHRLKALETIGIHVLSDHPSVFLCHSHTQNAEISCLIRQISEL